MGLVVNVKPLILKVGVEKGLEPTALKVVVVDLTVTKL